MSQPALIHYEVCWPRSRMHRNYSDHATGLAPGRVPKVARLMALALRLEGLLATGVVPNRAVLARLGKISRARVTQIMSLLHLAPDLQEALLFLPPTPRGLEPLTLRELLPIAAVVDWREQRRRWRVAGMSGASSHNAKNGERVHS